MKLTYLNISDCSVKWYSLNERMLSKVQPHHWALSSNKLIPLRIVPFSRLSSCSRLLVVIDRFTHTKLSSVRMFPSRTAIVVGVKSPSESAQSSLVIQEECWECVVTVHNCTKVVPVMLTYG